MGVEIERKYLVTDKGCLPNAETRTHIVQAYIALDEKAQVRVRILDDERAVLTVKSRKPEVARAEFEYPIPLADAQALLPLRTGSLIVKTRETVRHAGQNWEIDTFSGDLSGLVLAELELEDAEKDVERPGWIGREVTDDPRYYNASLAMSGQVPAEKGEEADCQA